MGLTAGRQAGREAGRRNTVGFRSFKTSLQVELFGFLICLISLQFYYGIRTAFQSAFVKLKFILRCVLKCEKFGCHFFSCQSLLLGTNVPNDKEKKIKCNLLSKS